jgi:GntR family transcriptional regulator/MocR family aminotransferase
MVLPREKSEALLEKINFYACTVPVFDQMVIAEFIRSGDFERHINRVRRKLRKNR